MRCLFAGWFSATAEGHNNLNLLIGKPGGLTFPPHFLFSYCNHKQKAGLHRKTKIKASL